MAERPSAITMTIAKDGEAAYAMDLVRWMAEAKAYMDALEAERDEWKRRAEKAERTVNLCYGVQSDLRAKLAAAREALEKVEWRLRNEHDEMAALVEIYDALAAIDAPQVSQTVGDSIKEREALTMTDRKKPKRPAIYKLDRGESAFGFDPLGPDLMLANEVDAYYGDLLRRAAVELVDLMKCLGSTIYDERYYSATNVIVEIREHLGEEA